MEWIVQARSHVRLRQEGVPTMLNKTILTGLACTIGFIAPAFGQGGNFSMGGAIGGNMILGETRHDNAPLSALWIDRQAHVTGNYKNAVANFDRVIRPDGTAMIMRRISDSSNPSGFAYLPNSWPPVGAMGKERVLDASGRTVVERDVIIPQFQILAAGIPMNGPPIATLAFERTIMADGTSFIVASAQNADPAVALALARSPDGLGRGIPYRGTTLASR